MSTEDNSKNDISSDICANCGKGEESTGSLKACTACKLVKYCNRECQIAHRSQHKKACRKRAKELHDENLFKQPPPEHGDCPICFLRLPTLDTGRRHMACCGKVICSGCAYAPVYDDKGNVIAEEKCPFCRVLPPINMNEALTLIKKRADLNDPGAIFELGFQYSKGDHGHPQDNAKTLELWHRAGELGYAKAYNNIGNCYNNGEGVEVDEKKAKHFYELSAMLGHKDARFMLGFGEWQAGDHHRSLKHYMIAVKNGDHDALRISNFSIWRGLQGKKRTQQKMIMQKHCKRIKPI